MGNQEFPTEFFCHSIVRLLDTIGYHGVNMTRVEHVQRVHYINTKTTEFFTRPFSKAMLREVAPARVAGVAQSISRLVSCGWPKVPQDTQVDITIFFVIANLFDDSVEYDPCIHMSSFWTNFIQGREQKHPFWMLMNTHVPQLLSSYGEFCAFNIMRSTFDFFQGCWIEHHQFHGYPGSDSFPVFLRRLTSLSGVVGGTLFPASKFSEKDLFKEMACVMAQIEGPETLLNDLISFYKEHHRNEVSLISTWCAVDGITIKQGLERLTDDAINVTIRTFEILGDKNPEILDTVRAFIHGYITWHLCEPRYCLWEISEAMGLGDRGGAKSKTMLKYRQYLEEASNMAWVNLEKV